MNKYQILVIGILFCSTLFGQSEAVEFSFDGCTYESSGAPFPGLTPNGDISCSCGVSEDAIVLDQPNEFVAFSELTQGLLSDDYTIDFYFKNSNTICQNCIILGLKNDCVGLDSFFVLRYTSFTNELTFEIGSDVNNFFSVKTELNSDICWHRFTLVKFGLVYTIYVDNVEVGRFLSKETIVFSQLGRLSISDSPCIGTNLTRWQGSIDEFIIHPQALSENQIRQSYLFPRQIRTQNITIFAGESLTLNTGELCNDFFEWSPDDNIDDIMSLTPTVSPDVTTTYYLASNDGICANVDSITVYIADPDALDCDMILLPKAFTPNNDGLNETFGINNTFIIEELIAFDIYDRWGERLWQTTDVSGRWDGFFNGVRVSNGMYMYKVAYMCNGQQKVKTGSLTVLR